MYAREQENEKRRARVRREDVHLPTLHGLSEMAGWNGWSMCVTTTVDR